MTTNHTLARRRWRDLCRTGALLSAVMFGSSVVGAITAQAALPAGAAPTAGQVVEPASGNAATSIALTLTSPNNACPGDTATGNFRWNTYIAASSVDPATIAWRPGAGGPIAAPGTFVQSLYTVGAGSPLISRNTAVDTGQIIGTQAVDFLTNTVPGNGTYNIGYSCTLAGVTERYWANTITVSEWTSATSFNWTATAGPAPTTTVAGATTTTVAAGATTTTVASGATTTTVRATTTTSATTTTVSGTSTTTTLVASGGPTTTLGFTTLPFNSGSSGSGGIPVTGPSRMAQMLVWGLLTLVFGRFAILLARPVRVLPPERR